MRASRLLTLLLRLQSGGPVSATALAADHLNFSLVTTLSRPDPGWEGASGRVTAVIDAQVSSVGNLAVYLCGGSGMIKDVTARLNAKGLCPIYREKYYD